MIKYFKELENMNNYYLPLVERNVKNYDEIYNFKLPISFYQKHKDIFYDIKVLNKLINELNIDKLIGLSYSDKCLLLDNIQSILEESYIIKEIQSITLSDTELYNYIPYYIDILNLLLQIYPNNVLYNEMLNRFKKAYSEAKIYARIEYNNSSI